MRAGAGAGAGSRAGSPAARVLDLERAELAAWLGDPPRHPDQMHAPFESDAEVVRLPDGSYLAASTDSLDGEIAGGLYRDPYTIGWVAIVNGLADLAAVGAEPVGVLLAASWDESWDADRRRRFGEGVGDALRCAGAALLGGDAGSAPATVVTVSAVGIVRGRPLSRLGAGAGDVVCITGRTGAAAALALGRLLGDDAGFGEERFRPRARLAEGTRMRALASSCTDASDGVVSAVDTIVALNGLGVALEWNPATLDPDAAARFDALDLPLWLLWLSEMSDFELVATVPEAAWPELRAAVPALEPIGRLTAAPGATLAVDGRTVEVDLTRAGQLARAAAGERARLLAEVVADARERGLP